jgi:ribose-phosphate pyrophosphokinase
MKSVIFFLDSPTHLRNEFKTQMIIENNFQLEEGETNVQTFSDGEISVDYETSVRGKRVYIVSSPDNCQRLMKLNIAIDAAKRASATEIIPIIPYFPYSRQDKKDQTRGAIGAKIVAEMLENRGSTSIITFDLHAEQIQGFFNIPVLHMEGKFLFDRKINDIYKETDGNIVLCSPDAGGAKRMKGIRDWINKRYDVDLPMILIDKTRTKANKVDDMVVIGEVEGKDVIIIDDMADTCGTLVKASTTLLEKGAKSVRCMVTHGVLSEPAIERLHNAINYQKTITEFICSDTLPLSEKKVSNVYTNELINGYDISTVVSTAPHIIKAMKAIQEGVSVQSLKTKK